MVGWLHCLRDWKSVNLISYMKCVCFPALLPGSLSLQTRVYTLQLRCRAPLASAWLEFAQHCILLSAHSGVAEPVLKTVLFSAKPRTIRAPKGSVHLNSHRFVSEIQFSARQGNVSGTVGAQLGNCPCWHAAACVSGDGAGHHADPHHVSCLLSIALWQPNRTLISVHLKAFRNSDLLAVLLFVLICPNCGPRSTPHLWIWVKSDFMHGADPLRITPLISGHRMGLLTAQRLC